MERRIRARREDNDALLAPTSPLAVWSRTQGDRWSARDIDLLESRIDLGEETEETRVRGPERILGTLGSRQ